jgi:hypothetical protein
MPALLEQRRDILRVLDRGGEDERLLPGNEPLIGVEHCEIALLGIDGFGELAEHEIACARRDGVEVDLGIDRVRSHRHEIAFASIALRASI